MGDVVMLSLEIPVERVISGATEADLSSCIVVGTTKEQNSLYLASSIGSIAENYAMLKIAASRLERMMEEDLK